MNCYQVILTLVTLSLYAHHLTNASIITNNCGPHINSVSVPVVPPKTDVGSYMIYQNFRTIMHRYPKRDVFIYWQDIDESDICGNIIEYEVFCSPIITKIDSDMDVHIIKTYKNYARFEELNSNIEYKCIVYSVNEHGASKDYSTVYVPKESDRNPKQLSVTKIEYDEEPFELSWSNVILNSSNVNQLYDYTLFWCEKNINQPYECNGKLNWTHIPNYESFDISYMFDLKNKMKNYRFAISLNTYLYDDKNEYKISNGMSWESCSVKSNKLPGKIDSIDVNIVSSKEIQMHWRLDCSNEKVIVQGYRIVYCSIDSNQNNSNCLGPLIETDINLQYPHSNHMVLLKYEHVTVLAIFRLEPLTTYKIIVSVMTNLGNGLPSDPIILTTQKEGDYNSSETGGTVLPWRLREGFLHPI